MEEVLTRITEAIAKLSEKHGETAVATVLETARFMAINDIIQAIISLIFGIGLIVFAYTASIMKENSDEFMYYLRKVFGYITGIIISMTALSYITNPIAWKSMSDPKYYVTYQILKKVK